MNMKHLIALVSTLLLFGASFGITLASAQLAPCPIIGRVSTIPDSAAVGLMVRLTSSNGAIVQEQVVNSYREYAFDVGNVMSCSEGTTFTIKIINCESDSRCTQTATIFGGYAKADFDLTGITVVQPNCPACLVCQDCPMDMTPYENCNSCCPTCPEVQPGYDWVTFITGGGIATLLAFLAIYFAAYKGKIRLQVYQKYVTSTGRNAYHWVTKFSRGG